MKDSPSSLPSEPDTNHSLGNRARWLLRVCGIVQGVGFRPFVYNTACALGLGGWVKNTSGQVEILIEGRREQLESFVQILQTHHPPQARIHGLEIAEESVGQKPLTDFQIITSTAEETIRPIIPADLALCEACRAEIHSVAQRRYRYPFTNCTHCGPRWSIIRGLPYDRPRTSMAHFAMCPDCQAEYENPADRRFHAQPIACPQCGPKLRLLVRVDRPTSQTADQTGTPIDQPAGPISPPEHCAIGQQACLPIASAKAPTSESNVQTSESNAPTRESNAQPPESSVQPPEYMVLSEGDEALRQAAQAILEGQIVALKGLGGFQLLCDATRQEVVQELRRRKGRPDKPFALMFTNLEQVRQVCWVSEAEAQLLQSPEAPILLLRRRKFPAVRTFGPQIPPVSSAAEAGLPAAKPGEGATGLSPPRESSAEPKAKPGEGVTDLCPPLQRPPQPNAKLDEGQLLEALPFCRQASPLPPAGGADLATTQPVPPTCISASPATTSPADQLLADAPGCHIAPAVAPGNPYLGVMLPYTPLHELLMEAVGRPIVCTSGNLSEEPMAYRTAEAISRLGRIADLILTHNRPIVRPVDDSVVRVVWLGPEDTQLLARHDGPWGGELRASEKGTNVTLGSGVPLVQVLRRARGYAPRPIELPFPMPPILALGGHLKNTVALSLGSQVVLSQHVGDLDNLPSLEVFQRTVEDLLSFFQVQPELVVCDLHPDYASTQYGEQLAERLGVPLVRVQHHEAHLAACLAEQGLRVEELAEPILGFSWDGSGYGRDGTLWGGEVLLWQAGQVGRIGSVWPFPLPGGDQAVRQPRRSALGVLYELLGEEAWERCKPLREWFSPIEQKAFRSMLRRKTHCPRASSMGRLFDAVAALCGLGCRISFEGQAAMALEFAAWEESAQYVHKIPGYPLPWLEVDQSTLSEKTATNPEEKGRRKFGLLDWRPMLQAVLADRAAGMPIHQISRRFHAALADGILQAAQWAAKHWQIQRVALSGGCFQNALLTQWAYQRLQEAGFTVLVHQQVPPGDGGIALGQILLAAWQHRHHRW
ncbi:MAG: Sua5/YciO/YrdC/YwlC family protein [Thermoguttaceae bacterium]|nr:Sua5/YciO/YrdC/YwlC family protein [Thermoguttaceae bacterium]